jgi:exoribonuclease II
MHFCNLPKAADPLRLPDLSLSVIKLWGSGEYVAEQPDAAAPGHLGLAVKDYAHSTAPNRRYVDLTTQSLLKAAIDHQPSPYSYGELDRHVHWHDGAESHGSRRGHPPFG